MVRAGRVSPAMNNEKARQVTKAPEAAASGNRVAPAPPGQIPYMHNKCGRTNADGTTCVNLKLGDLDTCLGHTPKKPRKMNDPARD